MAMLNLFAIAIEALDIPNTVPHVRLNGQRACLHLHLGFLFNAKNASISMTNLEEQKGAFRELISTSKYYRKITLKKVAS